MTCNTKFNYAIGHYWNNNPVAIGCYEYFGQVHFGTIEDATDMLEYVKRKSPNKDWRIFQVTELE